MEEATEGGHVPQQQGGHALKLEGWVMNPASMHCMTGEHSSEQRRPQEVHMPTCSGESRHFEVREAEAE